VQDEVPGTEVKRRSMGFRNRKPTVQVMVMMMVMMMVMVMVMMRRFR
jgi:hypothetical protein